MSPAAVDPAVLMTLAGIAYGAPASIGGYLAEATPTAGWQLGWLPTPPDPPVNFAYLATSADGASAVLAIRGTYPDPFSSAYWYDGNEDSPFGTMSPWPSGDGAKISAGTQLALDNLLKLADPQGVTLEAAVAALPAATTLTVTGHSLGGTLAPVIALWLSERFADRAIAASSFAGMTPGNGAFAALFGPGTALDGKVQRVFNTLDTVSYGWDQVLATRDFYQPAPQGGLVVEAMLLATAARLALGGYDYTAIGTPVALEGSVRAIPIDCALVAYVIENLHQHMPDTYLELLGAPPLPFSIGFGTIVAPRGHSLAAATPLPALPVAYL
ncbi:lipase family protein [Sphingomonas qomolangmaensis]|uniref:Fungal lipase-type domain-containing protein n=1 Tax=Sphingomonas qomolangmaensis TaxID=2918765 RepID=A0ABY5LE41_9SPHN|nr:hypothetical protein [Sphingomonas qomolangmaensis]UUL82981.1 hypothetical protein NMP03_01725 [Sphingomonas qomolangmaensis]